jgi:hypothetical protein
MIGGSILVMNRPAPDEPKYIAVLPDPAVAPTVRSRSATLWERFLVRQPITRNRNAPDGGKTAASLAVAQARHSADVSDILRDIANVKTRAAAVRSLRDMPEPPVDELAAELRSPLVERRLAAARALGAIPNPEVTEMLGRMLQREDCRREALAALMLSDNAAARQMLRSARRSRSIDAQCLAIQTQIRTEQVSPSL